MSNEKLCCFCVHADTNRRIGFLIRCKKKHGYVDYRYSVEGCPFYTADVEEVKHGHWIEQTISGEQTWCCSECKTLGSPHWKRCPVCEAKMDGGKRNAAD